MKSMMPVHKTRLHGFKAAVSAVSVAAVFTLAMITSATSSADALDDGVMQDAFLSMLVEALAVYDIDVASNLNSRAVMGQRIQKPRLGRFPDLPANVLPDSTELENWEAEFAELQIGGIAILVDSDAVSNNNAAEFLQKWLQSTAEQRLFVSFYQEDHSAAEKISELARSYGLHTLYLLDKELLSTAGNLYSTAAQRLAIDSRTARRYRSETTELSFLGERVRRNSNSLFQESGDRSLARREPPVFLKETLGDEFTESTIREIIVPGGVALGETASLTMEISSMSYSAGALILLDNESRQWRLPELDISTVKTLFDFVNRSESIQSDAIVDIDGNGRVRISSAFRDTDAGFEIMHADTLPFEYVANLPVTKSVMIDIGIDWFAGDATGAGADRLAFETDYEVRFLSADNMRLAQTRVALEYEYSSENDTASYQDSWGRDVQRLRDNLDYAGLGSSMAGIANYAGWIGLLRKLREDEVPFLQGRYQFMKVDKSGRATPSRY